MSGPWRLFPILPASRSTERRRIKVEALRGLGQQEELIQLLNPPQNVDEVVEVVSLLLYVGRSEDASDQLQASESLLTPSLFSELKATIAARGMSA